MAHTLYAYHDFTMELIARTEPEIFQKGFEAAGLEQKSPAGSRKC